MDIEKIYEKVYDEAFIYKITSKQSKYIYIGSTCKKPHQRLKQHKKDYRRYLKNNYCYVRSFDLIKYDDVKISIIYTFNNINNRLLRKIEDSYIRNYKNITLNKNRPYKNNIKRPFKN